MQPNALPVRLRNCPQWVCWDSRLRGGKQTKVPIDPATGEFASTADSETWGAFDAVLEHVSQHGVTGIGFVFTEADPYVGVDLDDCREPGTGVLTDEAVEVVTRLHSYTEVSPSGTGLHVLVRGRLPDGQRRHGSVEMYDQGRFFTMTGERLHATPPTVCERSGPIGIVHQEYVDQSGGDQSDDESGEFDGRSTGTPSSLEDEQLIEKARLAANGRKFDRLWNGRHGDYDSHSEADMALCCLLAFWTGGDRPRMDALFRESGLMRPKWDEVHYADGATYGERTIERACRQVTEHYSDSDS